MFATDVMGQNEFVVTVSSIMPDFAALPEWQRKVAYQQFTDGVAEALDGSPNLDATELRRVMFSGGQLDKYMRAAVKAGGIEEILKSSTDRLTSYQTLSDLARNDLRLIEQHNVSENIFRYCIDLAGDHTVLAAQVDPDYRVTALQLYENNIDLTTGQVVVQQSKREVNRPPKPKKAMERNKSVDKNQYEISCRPVEIEGSKTKAFVDVLINNAIQINGIRIVEGSKGLFVAMPSRPHQAEDVIEYRDIVFPRTAAAREALNNAILDTYYPEGGNTSQTVGELPEKMSVSARVTPYEDASRPNLRGLGSVTIGDFVIDGIQLLKGENGMFMNMPFKMLENNTGEMEFAKIATLTPKYMAQARGNMVMAYKHETEKKRVTEQGKNNKEEENPARIADQLAAAQQQVDREARQALEQSREGERT